MQTQIIPIGNSKGIRIPKSIISQCGFGSVVQIEVKKNSLVISPSHSPREGWEKAFKEKAGGNDGLLWPEFSNDWDDNEWTW